jgi:hypothetical protein
MNSEVIKGLFGLGSAILTGIVSPIIVNWYQELKKYPSLPNPERSKVINGDWSGTSSQTNGVKSELQMTFKIHGRVVKGKGTVIWDGKKLPLNLIGGFINDEILKIDYISTDQAIKNFGTTFLKLSGMANELNGGGVGFGSESEKIIIAEITLTKNKVN